MIGKTLGHYQIEAKLGEGGMGVVYKARDIRLDRAVALKVLPPERVADPQRKQRFIREAKAASALNHPNIITIYEIDQADGVDFMAMEYVEGRTLTDLIERGSLKLNETLKYAVQIAEALARAHATGKKMEVARLPESVRLFPFAISVAPDERSILYMQIDRDESDLMLVDNFGSR